MAAVLYIEHAVRDFDAWKRAFDSDPVGREQNGVRRYRVLRAADDPNFVVIELEFDGVAEAEAFAGKLLELWGRVTDELGLVGRNLRVLDSVESSSTSPAHDERGCAARCPPGRRTHGQP